MSLYFLIKLRTNEAEESPKFKNGQAQLKILCSFKKKEQSNRLKNAPIIWLMQIAEYVVESTYPRFLSSAPELFLD